MAGGAEERRHRGRERQPPAAEPRWRTGRVEGGRGARSFLAADGTKAAEEELRGREGKPAAEWGLLGEEAALPSPAPPPARPLPPAGAAAAAVAGPGNCTLRAAPESAVDERGQPHTVAPAGGAAEPAAAPGFEKEAIEGRHRHWRRQTRPATGAAALLPTPSGGFEMREVPLSSKPEAPVVADA